MAPLTTIQIDKNALVNNLHCVHDRLKNSRILAMVKSNAYGHGIERVVEALSDADAFGVARLEEAQAVRKANSDKPIVLVMGFFVQDELLQLSKMGCEVVVHHFVQIAALEQVRLSEPVSVWLKINTGMNRLGFLPEQVNDAYSRLIRCRNVKSPIKLMTHFSDADDVTNNKTHEQITLFNQITRYLNGERSLANSAGIIAFPESHAEWVRPGIMLYGCSPMLGHIGKDHGLQPVMTVSSQIGAINHQKKGDAIGYGSTWQCPENMPVGIVPIGYGEGYSRHVKSGTPILVNDHLCQIVGRVSMGMLTVDLRNYSQAKIGDNVILWGKGLPIEHIAKSAETISYELLCGMNRNAGNIIK